MPYIDITYIIFIIPALILGIVAQIKVNSAFNKYSQVRSQNGFTGADAARYILNQNGIYDVDVVPINGLLSDNYNPSKKTINLSESVYGSTSVAAIGVAAHETGHAIQHNVGYFPIKLREAVIPVSQIGSWLYLPLIFIGALLSWQNLINIGIILFATIALFQLITLPVEYNASSRALATLSGSGILVGDEVKGARKVLSAAALTYVAALIQSLAQLLRFILIFGGRRRN